MQAGVAGTSYTRNAGAPTGSWVHLAIVQDGIAQTMYVNGVSEASKADMPAPNGKITAPLIYNWIGRPPFSGDNYMRNTLVYDFRLYEGAISDTEITALAAKKADLDAAMLVTGDFTELETLIGEYETYITGVVLGTAIGQFAQADKDIFAAAIATAQGLVDANTAGQIAIDAAIATLKAAYKAFLSTACSAQVHPASVGATSYPFETGTYYIQVGEGDYFLTLESTSSAVKVMPYTPNDTKINNNQVWRVTYQGGISAEDNYLYSFVSNTTTWTGDAGIYMKEDGWIGYGTSSQIDNAWKAHQIHYNGTYYALWNTEKDGGKAITFPETSGGAASNTATMMFNLRFRTIDDVVENVATGLDKSPKNSTSIFGGINEIVISGEIAGKDIVVYDIYGRTLQTVVADNGETRINVSAGFYIVKAGKEIAKVFVRK